MLKIIYCLRRKPDLTPEEFQRYWREVHAPLVRKHQRALNIARYAQSHALANSLTERLMGPRGAPAPYDGVAELWYESREALESVGKNPGAREAGRELIEDEKRFIDLARSPIFVCEEHPIY